MKLHKIWIQTCALALFWCAWAPQAGAAVTVSVAGNQVSANIEVSGLEAELLLSFDQATNLSAANLNISAQAVSLNDAALLARLPASGLASLPSSLPLLITVEPPSGTGFAFNNTVRVEVHTHALPYSAGSHFRLYKAPLGGTFKDITDEVAPGSVRARGTTGGFSQFLVLLDVRSTSTVIGEKLSALQQRTQAAPTTLAASLQSQLTAVQSALGSGNYANALAALDQFRAEVSAASGSTLANQWTPSDRNNNVAGDLLAGAASLKFSISYLRDYGD